MTLNLLVEALQKATDPNLRNFLLLLVHELIEKFEDLERRQACEVEGLKAMVGRTSDCTVNTLEILRGELQGEIDVIAKAIEVGGLTAGHLGVGMS